jgi:hypothetical protein
MSERKTEITSTSVEKISQRKFIPLKIKGEDGVIKELSEKEVKTHIKKFVHGGKSPNQLEKQLIKEGVYGDAWPDREKIMALFSAAHDNTISKQEREELGRMLEENENE